jgi:hypothetical protein
LKKVFFQTFKNFCGNKISQDKAKQASHPDGVDTYVEWVRVAALTQYCEILAFPERDKILQDKA